jgi:hypothetical protein
VGCRLLRTICSRSKRWALTRGFARVRTFGWLHPAAKVRANRVRALLRQPPWLTPAEQQTWDPPADPQVEPPDVEPPESQTRAALPALSAGDAAGRIVAGWANPALPQAATMSPHRPPLVISVQGDTSRQPVERFLPAA